MKTLLEIVELSAKYLSEKGIVRPKREAEDLCAHFLGLKRIDLYLQFDRPMIEEELQNIRNAVARRGKGEPFQYIVGHVSFGGCRILVTPDVLIPRPETEILFEKIATTLAEINLEGKTLWDMCTGSGYLAIALKKRFPHLNVIGSDICPKALALARENALQNGVDVDFLEGDLFAPFVGKRCDFFVCNPPYVSQDEYQNLSPEVKDFEPAGALIGGPSGLEFYVRIATDLKKFLNTNGRVWLEMGTGQGKGVYELFSDPFWKGGFVEKDWAGHDRYFLI